MWALRVCVIFSREFLPLLTELHIHFSTRAFENTSVSSVNGHSISETFFIEEDVKKSFSQKIMAKPWEIWIEYSAIWGEGLTSGATRKFSVGVMTTLWVCKTFLWVRGTQRTSNPSRTISHSFYFGTNVSPLNFFNSLFQSHWRVSKKAKMVLWFPGGARLQEPLENFSEKLWTCFEYVKCSSRSELSNAPTLMTVRL